MTMRVLYHDRCFDGACSAALFTRFHRECFGTATAWEYGGLSHKPGNVFDNAALATEGENAVVDFKFTPSPRLTWWFDHHASAFSSAADEAVFHAEEQGPLTAADPRTMRKFFDPAYISCTGLIAHVAATRFGMDVAPLAELLHWADIIDGARFPSAEAVVGMREPAYRLMLAIENAADSSFGQRLIPLLCEQSLGSIAELPWVAERIAPLLLKHQREITLIGERAHLERGTISFDITDQPTEGVNKFIPYFLLPAATYTVALSKSSSRTKISVGTNPWTTRAAAELADIAAICARYGGGGHARVGAVSFPVDREDDARMAAAQIVRELRDRQ